MSSSSSSGSSSSCGSSSSSSCSSSSSSSCSSSSCGSSISCDILSPFFHDHKYGQSHCCQNNNICKGTCKKTKKKEDPEKCAHEEIAKLPMREVLATLNAFNRSLVDCSCNIKKVYPIHVTYSTTLEVFFGNEISIAAVQTEPTCVEVAAPKRDVLYSLFLIDPDFSARGSSSSNVLLWGIVNIPVQELCRYKKSKWDIKYTNLCIEKGYTFAPYLGPVPPPSSGFHRCTFLLYAQPHCIDPKNVIYIPNSSTDRNNFWSDTFLSAALGGGNCAKLQGVNYFVVRDIPVPLPSPPPLPCDPQPCSSSQPCNPDC